MRRETLPLGATVLGLHSTLVVDTDDERLYLDWEDRSASWRLRDRDSGEVVVSSKTLSGLDEAYKALKRRQRSAPFQRMRVIVMPKSGSYDGNPWVGTVTSWGQSRYFHVSVVWVVPDSAEQRPGHKTKEQVEIDRLRILDEEELLPLVNLELDKKELTRKTALEIKRLREVLKPVVFNDKDHPRFGADGQRIKPEAHP